MKTRSVFVAAMLLAIPFECGATACPAGTPTGCCPDENGNTAQTCGQQQAGQGTGSNNAATVMQAIAPALGPLTGALMQAAMAGNNGGGAGALMQGATRTGNNGSLRDPNPDPCDAKKQAEVRQKKKQFEQTVGKDLGDGALRKADFDPCSGKASLGANVAGCTIDAKDGKVNADCPSGANGDISKAEKDAIDAGNSHLTGRATMFGGPGDSSTNGWDNLTASGESTRTPGIAVNADGNATDAFNRSHLGGYWILHMDDGDWIYRQTDLGPAGWTGNKFDLSAGSLPAHGLSTSTQTSWNNVTGTYLGKDSGYAQYNGKCVANCR